MNKSSSILAFMKNDDFEHFQNLTNQNNDEIRYFELVEIGQLN
jgi:hypothetical protein